MFFSFQLALFEIKVLQPVGRHVGGFVHEP